MTRYVGSKWKKTAALMRERELSEYVPETAQLSKSSLHSLLRKYEMVYVKPVVGMHGNGVMRVERTTAGYQFQSQDRIRSFTHFDDMYRSILVQTRKKRYLVQKGIRLLKHNGRRFDIRVMAQYSPNRQWETTGIIGRVAAKNRIVTNFHGGGKLVAASRLLAEHTNYVYPKLHSLSKLGVKAGKAMQQAFPGVYEIGLDVALDQSLRLWILEVNTSPDPYVFKKLPDKTIFKRIMRYAKMYPKKRA
ncbi:YheC/YheD family protein [Paenibacillus sp. OV219]|uniref:YheC/YheD family protein n=1 Tax=Paenibacillus sp. OV219 TaxID=1884377 RepID=UPI0008BE669E|nr:YheC/YheD family protein [Paenibacillus sp. OV219]SEO06144.1 YheC/D like ATP-grasp [Paenibacillus sp. OV219]